MSVEEIIYDPTVFTPCDQCGARSYTWVSLPDGRMLSFCGSHFRTNESAFRERGYYILDRRDEILT